MAAGEGDAARRCREARRCRTPAPLMDPRRARALERLRHRPAAAGRHLKGAEAAFLKVTEMEPGYADGWVNVGARADPGRQHGGAERDAAEGAGGRSRAGQDALLPRHRAEEPRPTTTRRSTHLRAAAALSIRATASSLNQLGRVLFLKRAVQRRRSTAFEQGPGDRSRGSAGALQPDALLSGPRRRREGAAREQALYERFKADESSQAITGPYRQLHPDDNNERQQIHEHRHRPRSPVPSASTCGRRRHSTSRAVAGCGEASLMRSAWLRVACRRRIAPLLATAATRRRSRRCRFTSPTSPRRPASASGTTAAPSARSTCPRRSAPASRSSTSTATAGRTCCSSTR